MILRTLHNGNVAVRSGPIGDSSIPVRGSIAYTGRPVDVERATGLAAYGAAVRLIATTMATFDIDVYEGEGAMKREVTSEPVAELLDQPVYGGSSFDWLSDIAMSVETMGNAFCAKIRKGNTVVELRPIDPSAVRVRPDREYGKVFDVWQPGGWQTLTSRDILHVRGFTVNGFCSGFSSVQMYRHALGNALGLEEFQGRYFANDASPGVVLEVPGKPDREQARLMLETWQADHQGLPNARKPGIVWNGAKVTSIPVNMTDAQFIEAQRYGVEEVARITGVPAGLLDASTATTTPSTEQDWLRFLRLCLYPRSRRVLAALHADPDLFPDRKVYPAFEYDSMLAVDAATQATVDKEHVQSGIFLVDEIRARKGMGPLPPIPADWTQAPGMVPQLTPVGGAPNPTVGTGKTAPVAVADLDASISTED